MTPSLSIILIGYNSLKFLKPCLEGVHAQTLSGIETLFIDNASADGSVAFVRKNFPWATVIANDQNLGYVGAANQGIRLTKAPYVMILNPDLILTPDYLKKIVEKLQKDKKIGVITGKVLKYDFEKNRPTSRIDTTGLYCFRNRRIIDRGQGREDTGQYDDEEEVFGVSGAVPVYRRTALEDVKLPSFKKIFYSDTPQRETDLARGNSRSSMGLVSERSEEPASERVGSDSPLERIDFRSRVTNGLLFEYLDEDFFMYKEDIDVSWRLRLRGWKCYYLPQAVCYHGRGTGVLKRFSNWEVYKSRKHLNRFQKYYAYKNQRLMQLKNERWGNLLRDAGPILWKELVILGYIMVREPYLLKAVGHFFLQLPRALRKRRLIMKRRKVGAQEMDHWLSGKAKA